MPELYNQHYINSYSFPKGLIAGRKEQAADKKPRQSIYDMYTQPVRKGVSGWKLTKRMVASEEPQLPKKPMRRRNPGQSIDRSGNYGQQSLGATIENIDQNSGMLNNNLMDATNLNV